ncbi:hypothetical protein MTO96_002920 [Rhipicephalus appendiculatus]
MHHPAFAAGRYARSSCRERNSRVGSVASRARWTLIESRRMNDREHSGSLSSGIGAPIWKCTRDDGQGCSRDHFAYIGA